MDDARKCFYCMVRGVVGFTLICECLIKPDGPLSKVISSKGIATACE